VDAPQLLQFLTPVIYIVAAAVIALGLHAGSRMQTRAGVFVAVVGTIVHAWTFVLEFAALGGPSADFFSSLSLVSLLILVVMLVSMIRYPLVELLPLALPGAAFMALHKAVLSPQPVPLETDSTHLAIHVTASLLAYSLLSIAAVTAVVIAVLHNLLRSHRAPRIMEVLPPLVVMENLLFKMIGTGWLILCVSLATGLLFVDDLFAQHLAHKTALSILAWLIFGLLLLGRWRYGWRGMRVVRLCLIGMAMLLLAYFGSKAVLELVLDRRWQA
jgi:ABC-type uncharacterized transport system permease subunit